MASSPPVGSTASQHQSDQVPNPLLPLCSGSISLRAKANVLKMTLKTGPTQLPRRPLTSEPLHLLPPQSLFPKTAT